MWREIVVLWLLLLDDFWKRASSIGVIRATRVFLDLKLDSDGRASERVPWCCLWFDSLWRWLYPGRDMLEKRP